MTLWDKIKPIIHDLGRSEGREPGPEPGDGAVVHHSSGNLDFDGLPGDVLPPTKTNPERQFAERGRDAQEHSTLR